MNDVIYRANVNVPETTDRYYLGQAKDFKLRYRNHMLTFRNKKVDQVCNLKDEIWSLKENEKEFTLSWRIVRKSKSYKPGNKCCNLCLDEKLCIQDAFKDPNNINKDQMVQRPCLHKHFYSISNYKDRG